MGQYELANKQRHDGEYIRSGEVVQDGKSEALRTIGSGQRSHNASSRSKVECFAPRRCTLCIIICLWYFHLVYFLFIFFTT